MVHFRSCRIGFAFSVLQWSLVWCCSETTSQLRVESDDSRDDRGIPMWVLEKFYWADSYINIHYNEEMGSLSEFTDKCNVFFRWGVLVSHPHTNIHTHTHTSADWNWCSVKYNVKYVTSLEDIQEFLLLIKMYDVIDYKWQKMDSRFLVNTVYEFYFIKSRNFTCLSKGFSSGTFDIQPVFFAMEIRNKYYMWFRIMVNVTDSVSFT